MLNLQIFGEVFDLIKEKSFSKPIKQIISKEWKISNSDGEAISDIDFIFENIKYFFTHIEQLEFEYIEDDNIYRVRYIPDKTNTYIISKLEEIISKIINKEITLTDLTFLLNEIMDEVEEIETPKEKEIKTKKRFEKEFLFITDEEIKALFNETWERLEPSERVFVFSVIYPRFPIPEIEDLSKNKTTQEFSEVQKKEFLINFKEMQIATEGIKVYYYKGEPKIKIFSLKEWWDCSILDDRIRLKNIYYDLSGLHLVFDKLSEESKANIQIQLERFKKLISVSLPKKEEQREDFIELNTDYISDYEIEKYAKIYDTFNKSDNEIFHKWLNLTDLTVSYEDIRDRLKLLKIVTKNLKIDIKNFKVTSINNLEEFFSKIYLKDKNIKSFFLITIGQYKKPPERYYNTNWKDLSPNFKNKIGKNLKDFKNLLLKTQKELAEKKFKMFITKDIIYKFHITWKILPIDKRRVLLRYLIDPRTDSFIINIEEELNNEEMNLLQNKLFKIKDLTVNIKGEKGSMGEYTLSLLALETWWDQLKKDERKKILEILGFEEGDTNVVSYLINTKFIDLSSKEQNQIRDDLLFFRLLLTIRLKEEPITEKISITKDVAYISNDEIDKIKQIWDSLPQDEQETFFYLVSRLQYNKKSIDLVIKKLKQLQTLTDPIKVEIEGSEVIVIKYFKIFWDNLTPRNREYFLETICKYKKIPINLPNLMWEEVKASPYYRISEKTLEFKELLIKYSQKAEEIKKRSQIEKDEKYLTQSEYMIILQNWSKISKQEKDELAEFLGYPYLNYTKIKIHQRFETLETILQDLSVTLWTIKGTLKVKYLKNLDIFWTETIITNKSYIFKTILKYKRLPPKTVFSHTWISLPESYKKKIEIGLTFFKNLLLKIQKEVEKVV